DPEEHGVMVAGGKGGTSQKTPQEIEQLEEEIREKKVEVQEKQAELEDFRDERNQTLAENKQALEDLYDRREEAVEQLEKQNLDMLDQYERLRDRRGTAVAAIEDHACGGCHSRVPAQQINEVKKMDEVHYCDMCNRILYWEESEENGDD
ncbi:MAG: C4-type zinc ribbon domain-containing protein, partial [bacterium]